MQENLRNKTISNTFWKFAERMIAQGVSLVVSIILARLLTPEDYGVVSIVTIFFSFANVLITGGLNSALIQKKDADIEDYSSVLYASVTVSVVIYLVLFFASPEIANLYGKPELVSIFRVMGLILPVSTVESVVCANVSANLQFRKFFAATIGGTIVSAVVGIVMATNGCGAWSLVAQHMTNTFIDTIILLFTTKIRFVLRFNVQKFKKLYSYGWKVLVSSLIDTAYNQISPLFIGVRYSGADLSYYNRGQTFPNIITATVNSTLAAVLFPVLTKVQDDKQRLLNYTRLFMRISSYLVFPMMLGLVAISDNFVSVLLTDKWSPASIYIKIFCVSNMFIMIATGNCETIKAMGRSDIFLKMEILKKTCYFIIIGAFIFASNSPVVLALSSVVCTVIAIFINTFPNRKLLGYSYWLQIQDLLPNLIISGIMAALVATMNHLKLNVLLLILIQIIVGAVIYVLLSMMTKNPAFEYVMGLVKEFAGERKKAKGTT